MAALAERYAFDDPNTALIKLRQFAELLAENCAAHVGITIDEGDRIFQILQILWDRRVVSGDVSQLFHGLRKAGNEAVHSHHGDRREALHQLQMARKLAVWFHKTFGRDRNFKAGPFIPPPDPTDSESELHDELERLREEVTLAKEASQKARASAEEHARLRELAEAEANEAYEELNAALEMASETEQQLNEEREGFEARLLEITTVAKAMPQEEQNELVEIAQLEGEDIDLDEVATRRIIDAQLREAGWEVDSATMRYQKGTRPAKGRFMAISEWPTAKGPADYCLFFGLTPIAIIEAKKNNKDVAGSIQQTKRYSRGFQLEESHESPGGPWDDLNIPFLFASNGRAYLRQIAEKSGIWFLDARRNVNHPHPIKTWYTPEGLKQLLDQDVSEAEQKLQSESTDYLPLRDYQTAAIRAAEENIAKGKQELLLAMATGTGKTRTCIGMIYRLIKSGRFRRILFLVDRSALGEQTHNAFRDVHLENHQTFSDIYDIKALGDLKPDSDTRLHISTVQGMVKRVLNPSEAEPPVPVDWYDCIIIDECHRGYNLDQEMSDAEMEFRDESDYVSKYRQVIDHFDAVRIGLTATPALHTTEIFGLPVYQYSYRQAVIDGWLVDHEPPFRIVTKLSEDGIHWDQGDEIKVYHTKGEQLELFNTPDEVDVEVESFNKRVITENFNHTVCKFLAEQIDPSLPGKTLIFCVNDMHADLVVRLLKEAFDEQYGEVHDDAVIKITGKADKPLDLIRRFKNESLPNVVVTVDLLTTGVDIPSITNLVFLRRVKSRILFEQMLGRATRLCENLYGPDEDKERFHIYDAVDLYPTLQQMSDMKPVVTKVNATFGSLIEELITTTEEDARNHIREQILAKLQRKKLSATQQEQLEAETGFDKPALKKHIRDTDANELAEWLQEHSNLGSILDAIRKKGSSYLVSEHEDELRRVERGYGEGTKPEDYLDAFRKYITEHLDDVPALVVVTQRPKDLTRAQLKELRLELDQAGFNLAGLRSAWRETTNQDIAASIIGYIRHVACDQPLMAHKDRVQAAMKSIIESRQWTDPQRKWLDRIGKQLEQEIIVDREAIDAGQFKAEGGFDRLNKVFKGNLETLLTEIADTMWQVVA